jgi:hypothetical protein
VKIRQLVRLLTEIRFASQEPEPDDRTLPIRGTNVPPANTFVVIPLTDDMNVNPEHDVMSLLRSNGHNIGVIGLWSAMSQNPVGSQGRLQIFVPVEKRFEAPSQAIWTVIGHTYASRQEAKLLRLGGLYIWAPGYIARQAPG